MPSIKEQIRRQRERDNKLKDNPPKFKSTHNLEFFAAPHWTGYMAFKVGTCDGLYNCEGSNYNILAIINDKPGNGHLQDVFDWFENSCKRDKKGLMIQEVWNEGFKKHLIEKRGFVEVKNDYLLKSYEKIQGQ